MKRRNRWNPDHSETGDLVDTPSTLTGWEMAVPDSRVWPALACIHSVFGGGSWWCHPLRQRMLTAWRHLKGSRFESPDTEHGFSPSLITDIGGGFDCSPTQLRHLDYITAEMFAIPWGIKSRVTELTSTAHCPPNSCASGESMCCWLDIEMT